MKHARKLSALLALLTVLAAFAACSSEPQNGGNVDTETTTAETTTEETTTQSEYDIPEVVDYDGYEYRIGINKNANEEVGIMFTEEMDGEVLNDAIFKRNSKIADMYNISIVGTVDSGDAIVSKLSTNVRAGDDVFDIVSIPMSDHFTPAKDNIILELNSTSLDLEQPWWETSLLEAFRIKGKNYITAGDLTFEDDMLALVMMFNVKLYNDYGFENPYTMVSEGRWTFDTFWEMAQTGSKDINGDGVMDTEDRWGFITEGAAWYYYSVGAGFESIRHTSDGGLEYVIDGEKNLSILEKTKQVLLNKEISLMAQSIKKYAPYGSCWELVRAMFIQDQGLFNSAVMSVITEFRDMDTDFGVLPMPKYDESQDDYRNLITYHADAVCFPITLADEARTMRITDALSCESMLSVSDVLYNVFLDEKLVRDEESKGMLDIILGTKVYDLEFTTNLSGLTDIMWYAAVDYTDNFVSKWAAAKDSASVKLAKFVEDIAD